MIHFLTINVLSLLSIFFVITMDDEVEKKILEKIKEKKKEIEKEQEKKKGIPLAYSQIQFYSNMLTELWNRLMSLLGTKNREREKEELYKRAEELKELLEYTELGERARKTFELAEKVIKET